MPPSKLPVHRRDVFPAIGSRLLVTIGLAASPPPLLAQQPVSAILVGHLIDRQSGTAIVGARLVILGWSLEAGSDSAGRFTYTGLYPGSYMLQARAVGYTVTNWVVKVSDAEEQHRTFPMTPLALELDPVTVEGRASLAEQRRLEFVCNSAGCTMRMTRSPRNCLPDYFVDGFPATNSTTAQLPTVGIIGIEVYASLSETPQQFLKSDTMCGAIVIWTRSGPS